MSLAYATAVMKWKGTYGTYITLLIEGGSLFSHPDVTDDQRLEWAKRIGTARNQLIEAREHIVQHPACSPRGANQLRELPL